MTVLFEAPAYLEGPRVRSGALYCTNAFTGAVLRFHTQGQVLRAREPASSDQSLVCKLPGIPCGLGFLPDGDLLVLEMTARKLWRHARGELSLYADLSALAAGTIDDMIVDAQGNAYVGDLGFDLFAAPKPAQACGRLLRVAPDGTARVVAEGLDFPNGMAVSADGQRLAVAESSGDSVAWFQIARDGELALRTRTAGLAEPDGVCLARDGKLWVAQFRGDSFVCLDEAGQHYAELPTPGFRAVACWLSEDEQTLFALSARTTHDELLRGKAIARIEALSIPGPAR
jgi:sugar lactone lactonase YvrE